MTKKRHEFNTPAGNFVFVPKGSPPPRPGAVKIPNNLGEILKTAGLEDANTAIRGLQQGHDHHSMRDILNDKIKNISEEYQGKVEEVEAYKDVLDWFKAFTKDIRLGKPVHSAFQQVEELVSQKSADYGIDYDTYFVGAQVFIIQHDWAKLIKNSEADTGDVDLPGPRCAFEVEINGKRVVALYDEDHPWQPITFIRASRGVWVSIPRTIENKTAFPFMNELVRAACIMLEARVAETEVVRAPLKLNEQRRKNSRLPLRGYYVVRLDRRHHVRPSEEERGPSDRRLPRLHFRRSHWRHFPTHKVKIPWTLAGKEELGWVDKEYRL